MANRAQKDCYANPAFCMQSEYYRWKTSPNKKQTPRQSPVGANVSVLCEEKPVPGPKPKRYVQNEEYDEQDFYEEMLVDDSGVVKCKKLVVVTSPNQQGVLSGSRYAEIQGNVQRCTHRYEEIPDDRYEEAENNGNVVYLQANGNNRNRYEYIQVPQEEIRSAPPSPQRVQYKPQEIDANALKEGYALVRRNDRYEMLPLEKISDTYRYNSPNNQKNRYEYISNPHNQDQRSRYEYPNEPQNYQITMSPQTTRRAGNLTATQKLHELLSTPKKNARPPANNFTPQKPMSPHSPRKIVTPTASPIPKNPFVTPTKQQQTPRAQQKLNYALATRQVAHQDKRHTAIISPICSSPIQSVYSETTYSNKSESWMNLSLSKAPVQATLAVAAIMMTLCGGVTSGLCFYMVWIMGRLYYLDFGIVAGFTCLLLGLLGFRSRNCRWLPNRNYISGN